jgi:hypothetical protein
MKTARIPLGSCFVYAIHRLSGDHDGFNPLPGPTSYDVVSIFAGCGRVGADTSTTQRFSALSLRTIRLLSGDHVGE